MNATLLSTTVLSTSVDNNSLNSQPQSVEVPDAAQLRSLSLAHRLSLRLAIWLLVRAEHQRENSERALELYLAQKIREQLLAENRALALTHSRQLQMY